MYFGIVRMVWGTSFIDGPQIANGILQENHIQNDATVKFGANIDVLSKVMIIKTKLLTW